MTTPTVHFIVEISDIVPVLLRRNTIILCCIERWNNSKIPFSANESKTVFAKTNKITINV